MSLADLIFYGNQDRRNKVTRLSAKLSTLLETNFKRTNDLIDCIHKYVPGKKFLKVTVNENATIKENCEVIIDRIEEIENYVEENLIEIRKKVDVSVYAKLIAHDTTFMEKIRIAKAVVGVGKICAGVAAIVIVVQIYSKKILSNIAVGMNIVAKSILGGLAFCVLVLAIDMIISAILGYIERSKLETSISELETVIKEFEPASHEFNKGIERLIIRIEDNFE